MFTDVMMQNEIVARIQDRYQIPVARAKKDVMEVAEKSSAICSRTGGPTKMELDDIVDDFGIAIFGAIDWDDSYQEVKLKRKAIIRDAILSTLALKVIWNQAVQAGVSNKLLRSKVA